MINIYTHTYIYTYIHISITNYGSIWGFLVWWWGGGGEVELFPAAPVTASKVGNTHNHSHECHDVLFMGLRANGLCDGNGTLSALCVGILACSVVVLLRSFPFDCPMALGHTKLGP